MYFMNQLKYHNLVAVNDTRIRAAMYLLLKSIVRQNDLVKISIGAYVFIIPCYNLQMSGMFNSLRFAKRCI